MNATAIDRLIRAQAPIQAYQQRAGASLCLLRQDLEALGIDPEALESALGVNREPLVLTLVDSGLSAEADTPCAGCADKQATIDAAKVHADTYLAANADLKDRLAGSVLRNLRWQARTRRLVAIARRLRQAAGQALQERDAIAAGAFKTEQERDRLLAEFNARGDVLTRTSEELARWRTEAEEAHGSEERLGKELRQALDLASIRESERDDARVELAEARAKLESAQIEGLRLAGYLDALYPDGWSGGDFEGPSLPFPTAFAKAAPIPARLRSVTVAPPFTIEEDAPEPEAVPVAAPAPVTEPEPTPAPVAMCPGYGTDGCPHGLPVKFPISGLCNRCQGKKNRASQPSKPARVAAPKPAPTPQPKAVAVAPPTSHAFSIDAGGVPHTSTSILACVRTAMHKRAWFRLAIDENGPVALPLGKGGDAWLKPLCDVTPEGTGWRCTAPPTGVTRHPAAVRVTEWLDGIVGAAARRSND